MPDRRRRTAFRLPLPERAAPLTRDRQDRPSPSSEADRPRDRKPGSDNPFAAPPADRPDQPWQPRHPSGQDGGRGTGDGEGSGDDSPGDRSGWGSKWSSKQPGRGNGGWGGRPGGNGSGGRGGPGGAPGGLRWDPTDPTQRRARYALLGGMWAVFFALFDFPEIALLLGSLAVYWAISALRTPPKNAAAGGAAAGGAAAGGAGTAPAVAQGAGAAANRKQQTTAAISGLVTASLALLIVVTTFTVQLVYRDYYTCVNDALTKTGALSCNDQLPKPLEPLFGVKE
ncbi:hypothetical protein [Streptomyces sp. NPDC101181]|uniref:hypothetical protein n=1 Tax=Streptomyces sp. NPDC101181 TaxID=3366125 RepID=UPI00380637E3